MNIESNKSKELEEIKSEIWKVIYKQKELKRKNDLMNITFKLDAIINKEKQEVKDFSKEIHDVITMKDISNWIMDWSCKYQDKFKTEELPIHESTAEALCQSIHIKIVDKLKKLKFD